MRNEVLLLNADAAPVNWLPLSSISWQNAVRLIWLDVVEVLHTYEDRFVRSPSLTIEMPAVVMLRRQVKGFRNWVAHEYAAPAYLIFLRDSFTCQYCLRQFSRKDLTVDHVKPKCYGGQTSFNNCVAACSPCNGRRGSNYLIKPAIKPYLPTITQLVRNMRKFPLCVPHESWIPYLKWPPELIYAGTHTDHFIGCNNFDGAVEVPLEYYIS